MQLAHIAILLAILLCGCSGSAVREDPFARASRKIWSTGEEHRVELCREGEEPDIALRAFRNSAWPDEGYKVWAVSKLLTGQDQVVGYRIQIVDPRRSHGRGALIMTIDGKGRIVRLVEEEAGSR